MKPTDRSLTWWLGHMEALNPASIDLGLARVREVGERMAVLAPAPVSVIVAGTNGKGSTCVCLEQILLASGRRTGCTLSPHLQSFRERVRINGIEADQATLCTAFEAVEAARGDLALTYFEYSCLATLFCFKAAAVDVAILEVGLGGRLDAFNIVDADVAVVTSIGLDHMAYLGDSCEAIGAEKAGVFRAGQRIALGAGMPDSVLAAAARATRSPMRWGEDVRLLAENNRTGVPTWHVEMDGRRFSGLPFGVLPAENCALATAAACAVDAVMGEDRVDEPCVHRGWSEAWLPGRLEAFNAGGRQWLVDVAHNPLGAAFLNVEIPRRFPARRVVAVFGNLHDKDSGAVCQALDGLVRHWVLVDTTGPRGLTAEELSNRCGGVECSVAGDLDAGLALARSLTEPSDVILAFGSFAVAQAARSRLTMTDIAHRPRGE
ncbi:MAG: bifunctional folylpolyglutamate synthase/dihydrofolate synthase [Gammaproteobacteria bacterium]|nr:bifunctional folylpolyglutamate synthase/dihydrofolate synthase [Gammaproteobacteria bacterium]